MWKKEPSSTGMYVDLFQVASWHQSPVEKQYLLNKMSKKICRADRSNYKSDVTADQHRQNGNKMFEKDRFTDAMEWYNESLCFAKNGSKTIGLAYSNRSVCFLEMKMFKKCLVDIELAKQNK